MLKSLLYKIKDLFKQKIFILLTLDKAFQFLSQLLIVFLYRPFIGLSNYADFVFALVFFTIISAVSNLGMDRLLLEKFSIESKLAKWNQLLFSSIFYKVVFSIFIIITIKLFENIGIYYYGTQFSEILFIMSFGLLGQSYLLLDAFCQAKKKNIITVKSRITVVLIINILRILIVYFVKDSFYIFLWTFPIEQALYFIFSIFYGRRYFSKIIKFVNYQFEFNFLKNGIVYTISVLLIIFQMKYVFLVVKLNLSKEFYEYYSIVSYLCDITFSIPALLSLFYRPDLARYYNTNDKVFKKIFFDFTINMFTLSLLSSILICLILYIMLTFSYSIDIFFAFPLYMFTLVIPIFFFSYTIQVIQITMNSMKNFLLSSLIGSIVVFVMFYIVTAYSSNNSFLIILTYLLSYSIAQIALPLFLEREKIKNILI